MSDLPKTLLQMAGAPSAPGALSEAVVLLIDCQYEYVDGALALPDIEPALAEIESLCDRARTQNTPVVHVVHRGRPGGPFDLADHRGAIAAPRQVEASDIRIEKPLPNAFADTDLLDRLRGIGRKELIVAGFMTHMCVSSTVRAALDLGFRSTVVASATATRDLPSTDGGIIDAAVLKEVSLAALADRFAVIAANVDALPD